MDPWKRELAKITNPRKVKGSISDAMKGADVFIGLSGAERHHRGDIKTHGQRPHRVRPGQSRAGDHARGGHRPGAGRGHGPVGLSRTRSTTCSAFPGIFRGALDIRARGINDEMKLAAACAIADLVGQDLRPGFILPGAMDFRVPPAVAEAVARAGMASGMARLTIEPEHVARHTREYIYDERLSIL